MVRDAGYTVKYKPRKSEGVQTVNPLNHPFPHAKLYNGAEVLRLILLPRGFGRAVFAHLHATN